MKAELSRRGRGGFARPSLYAVVAGLTLSGCAGAPAPAAGPGAPSDPRPRLSAGYQNAEEAAWNLELVAHVPRPEGFFNPQDPGDFDFANTDMAFRGNFLFMGSYNGIQIFDISDPENPRLRSSLVCPGGQGDVSVHGDLLFMSVEETRGRVDCGAQTTRAGEPQRFRGVRVFDVSNLDAPRQVAAVQTCRGSHTHTLVTDPDEAANVYIYVSGTGQSRLDSELAGCVGAHWRNDPSTAYWRIEVIRVPVAAPQDAAIVNMPRIFADEETGAIGGLWEGGPVQAWRAGIGADQPVPRHHRLPGDRAGRRRLCGERHPAGHLRSGESTPHRRYDGPKLRLLALGDLQSGRHEGDLHR
mgnify:CR=1 FL=1